MITSVYISDRSIQVVVGKPGRRRVTVREMWREELSPGILSNGGIIKADELRQSLEALWKSCGLKKKRVQLVLNSSQITLKRLELPVLGDKKIRGLLPREMEVTGETPVYEYMKMGTAKKKTTIYAGAVDQSIVMAYKNLFAELGIKLDKILVSRLCVEKLLEGIDFLKGKSCIIEILNGLQMMSVLLVEGKLSYYTQSHIFGEYGSFQFGLEISRSVSNLQQFFSTQEKQQKIEEVYLCGICQEDFLICEEAIEQMVPDVDVIRMEKVKCIAVSGKLEENFGDYFVSIGGLFRRKNEIDFSSVTDKHREKKERKEFWKYATLPMILTVGCAAVSGALLWTNHLTELEVEEQKEYLLNTDYLLQSEEAEQLTQENTALQAKLDAVAYMDEVLSSYPRVNSAVVRQIQQCAAGRAEVAIESYYADTGLLTLNTKATEVNQINRFIDSLQQSGLFQTINYTGYTYSAEDRTYTINVLCYLQEQAGKEAEE